MAGMTTNMSRVTRRGVAWREASPLKRHGDLVDSDQWVVSKELYVSGVARAWAGLGQGGHGPIQDHPSI